MTLHCPKCGSEFVYILCGLSLPAETVARELAEVFRTASPSTAADSCDFPKVFSIFTGDVHILNAWSGELRPPAYPRILRNRIADIKVVDIPADVIPHRCWARRRPRPSRRFRR